jgi:hypothetical protein
MISKAPVNRFRTPPSKEKQREESKRKKIDLESFLRKRIVFLFILTQHLNFVNFAQGIL